MSKRFYTSAVRIANNICVRGHCSVEGAFKHTIPFAPTMYMRKTAGDGAVSSENSKDVYRDMTGAEVMEINLDYMAAAQKDFINVYKDVSTVKIYGQQNWILQYLNKEYPGKLWFDSSKISAWGVDIETKLPTDANGVITGFPDVDTADAEVTMITMERLSTGQCWTFASKDYQLDPNSVAVSVNEHLGSQFTNYGLEEQMLKAFIDFWDFQQVEVITGWNLEGFDIPYLYNRIKNTLGTSWVKRLSPWGKVEQEKKMLAGKFGKSEETVINIAGVSVLDYMVLYKKFVFVKHESYSLSHIALAELGIDKLSHDQFKNFNDFYDNGFNLYTEYNIHDTRLVGMLDNKLRLLELVYTIAYLAKINYTDVFSPVKTWDAMLHNKLLADNVVVPLRASSNAQQYDANGEVINARSIEGAYVKEPQVGMHEWVVSLDATSLYPSIMKTLNISPETYLGITPGYKLDSVLSGDVKLNPGIGESMAVNGTKFDTTTVGVIPTMITEMMADRKTAKKKMLSKQQLLETIRQELSTRK